MEVEQKEEDLDEEDDEQELFEYLLLEERDSLQLLEFDRALWCLCLSDRDSLHDKSWRFLCFLWCLLLRLVIFKLPKQKRSEQERDDELEKEDFDICLLFLRLHFELDEDSE